MNARVHILFGVAATVLVAAVVVWGFMVVGSPDTRSRVRTSSGSRFRTVTAYLLYNGSATYFQ